MTEEEIEYIFRHYQSLMNVLEHAANSNFFFDEKLRTYPNTSEGYRKRLQNQRISKPAVLKLMEDGYVNFRRNVAERIMKDHKEGIVFNRCPKCNQIVRTPLARQCNHCFYKWHNTV